MVYCCTPKALYNQVCVWGGVSPQSTTSLQHPLGWCDGCHRTTEPVRSPHTSYRWRGERVIEQSSVCAHTHQLQVERERVIEPIKCMLSPHTSYRWERRESHRANQVYALTTHQLQVESRERVIVNQVYALTTHQLQVGGERVIEPIKCMLSHPTSYRWRGGES